MGSVKISKPLCVSKVKTYWDDQYTSASENYYSDKGKSQGRWFGQTAAQFELVGGVTREQFDHLAEGRNPITGEQLVKWIERVSAKNGEEMEHRAAYDFTIAPHKSISAAALVGGDERLVALHERAVMTTMQAAERYTQAHVFSTSSATTGNMIAAMFTHTTTRPVNGIPDPHLHTHVVAFNMTDDNGKIRAIEPHEWYRIQRYLDAVYQAEMAVGIQELGYTLERNRDGDYAAIAGYSQEYLDSISRRTTQIEERKAELGIYGAKADHIIAHQNREAKVDWSTEKLREYHAEKARSFGINPEAIPAAARLQPERSITPHGTHDSITYSKKTLSERTAVFDHDELMEEALRHGLGTLRLKAVEQAFHFRQSEFPEVQHYRENAPGSRHTTPEALRMERELMEAVAVGHHAVVPFAPETTRDEFRRDYSHRLNNSQMWLAYNVLTSPDRVMAIQGGGGVGKTVTLEPIRSIIEAHGYDVYGLAPTSGAASELTKAGITNSQTIQRFVTVADKLPTEKPRVMILDESSLASTAQVHALFQHLRPQDRVILAGDIRQHQSVEAGRIFEQLQQAGMSTFHLNKIMRQKDSPELLAAVKEFSAGRVYEGLNLFEEQGRIHEHASQHDRYNAIAERYMQSPGDSIVITPDNDSIAALSANVRTRLIAEGLVAAEGKGTGFLRNRQDLTAEAKLHAFSYHQNDVVRFARKNKQLGVNAGEYATVRFIDRDVNTITVTTADNRTVTYTPHAGVQVFKHEERTFAVGDRIQFTQPWRDKRINNRDFAEITYLDQAGNIRVMLDKRGHRHVSFNLKEMPHLDYGYAVTSYSIQGASRQNVLVHVAAEDTCVRNMLDKIFINVAVGRSIRDCAIFCDSKQHLGPTLHRVHLKPKAHSTEQIKEYRSDYQMEHTA